VMRDKSIPFVRPESVPEHIKVMSKEELGAHFDNIKETWHKAFEEDVLCRARNMIIEQGLYDD